MTQIDLRQIASSPKFLAQNEQDRANALMKFAPYDSEFLKLSDAAKAVVLNKWVKQQAPQAKVSPAQSVAAVGDLFAGAPAFLVRTGAEFGNAIVGGVASPWTHQTSAQIWHDARESAQGLIAHASKIAGVDLSAPLESLLQKLHPAPGQQNALPNKVMGLISKHVDSFADEVAKKTNGAVPADAVKSYFDALMTTGVEPVTRLLRKGGGKVEPTPKEPAPSGEESPTHTQTPTGEAIQRATGATPAADLTRKAQGLIDRNASVAEVQAAIKKDKKLGPEIDRIMEERRSRAQAFQDKESKIGQVQTPEEYAAEQSKQDAMTPKVEGPQQQPRLPHMMGEADPKVLAALGLGAGATLAYPYLSKGNQQDLEYAGLGAALITQGLPEKGELHGDVTLRDAMKASPYTLKTLDRLPPNQHTFSKQQIEDLGRKQDVTDAERGVLGNILALYPGKKITAKQLAEGMKIATGDFHLERMEGKQYADYGIQNIRPEDRSIVFGREHPSVKTATTNLYDLPPHIEVSADNHFDDPHLYGWTRSFEENGVRHVVEVQSDLAQHVRKKLTEGDVAELQKAYDEYERRIGNLRQQIDTIRMKGSVPSINLSRRIEELELYKREIDAKLGAGKGAEQLGPILKNWPRRLIREELSHAASQGMPVVRFASADTVAKVEGWPGEFSMTPEGVRYGFEAAYPEHQGIYNRYAGEITKYLKSLGAQEVTDDHGHTWLETPTSQFHGPKQMFGHADPKLLALMAAGGTGALIGAGLSYDDPVGGAVLGAIAGLSLGRLIPKVGNFFHALARPDTRIKIGEVGDRHEAEIKRAAVIVNHLQHTIVGQVAGADRRAAITHWLEGDKSIQLTPEEKAVAQRVREFFNEVDKAARSAGVYQEGRENYVTHLWDFGIQRGKFARAGLGTTSPYAKARSIPTLKEGMAQGLTPLTQDISEIVGIYGNSMMKAIANKKFITSLKGMKVPSGVGTLIMSADKAPFNYQSVEGIPSLMGMKVHPDIVPSIRFLAETRSTSAYVRGAEMLNSAIKRSDVSFSLFHAKSLLDAHVAIRRYSAKDLRNAAAGGVVGAVVGMALGDPAWGASYGAVLGLAAKDIAGYVRGTDATLKGLREQGLTPDVDYAIESGLQFSLPKATPIVEDTGTDFYGAMTWLQGELDSVPVVGKLGSRGMEAYKKINHAEDNLVWSQLHAGMKFQTFLHKSRELAANNPEMSRAEAGRKAAEFANDIYGGLNWRRIAEESHTHVLRQIALWMNAPKDRRVTQLLVFAPDWTLSTARAAYKGARALVGDTLKGKPFKGLHRPQDLGDLYKQYLWRSMIYYTLAANAINYAHTGHSIFTNKDPTRIDLGNGQTMSWSKHFTESFEWLRNPSQQFANKLAFLPSEAIDQLAHIQYLNTTDFGASPKMQEGRLTHAAKRALPINLTAGSAKQAVFSTLGTPIYGQTNEQRASKALRRRMTPPDIKKKLKKLEELGQ